jgi:hypothetical protein
MIGHYLTNDGRQGIIRCSSLTKETLKANAGAFLWVISLFCWLFPQNVLRVIG